MSTFPFGYKDPHPSLIAPLIIRYPVFPKNRSLQPNGPFLPFADLPAPDHPPTHFSFVQFPAAWDPRLCAFTLKNTFTIKNRVMKNLLAAIASFILLQPLTAQTREDNSIPQAVTTAFSDKFPDGDLQKWETRKEGYIARFKKDGKKHTAYYSAEGHWKGTESKIRWTRHLPAPVKAAWENSGYADWYVHNIKKIETPDQRLYVLHVNNTSRLDANKVENFKEDHILYFTPDGELVKKDRI
jgi:hypothetical protein